MSQNEDKARKQIADAIHDALCGQCRPKLRRDRFTREDADGAADAAMPIVRRVLDLANEIESGALGHLEPGQVAYLIRVAVYDSVKAAAFAGAN